MLNITKEELAGYIELSSLKPDVSYGDIKRICLEAERYGFIAVAVNPVNVSLAAECLRGTKVKVCAALGFYSGAYPPEIKHLEARDAINKGADELDIMMNVGALKAGRYEVIEKEVTGLVKVAEGKVVKIILETCFLTDEEIIKASFIIKSCGADFVKTSTGFKKPGATVNNVKLIRKTVGNYMGVKAAGGIYTTKDALLLIEAGANRLGVSNGVAIIEGCKN